MNASQREALKKQLRAMADGQGDGVDLDTRERWAISEIVQPVAFFSHLHLLIPQDSILYVEGTDIAPEAAALYESNRALKGTVCVAKDMIYPVPQIFHVQMGLGMIDGLITLLEKRPRVNCFTHLKGYREGRLLFAFHDVFESSELLVSDEVAEEGVRSFCEKMRVAYRREPNARKRNTEVFQLLLEAMENPQKLRMFWPWWKKALFFWKK